MQAVGGGPQQAARRLLSCSLVALAACWMWSRLEISCAQRADVLIARRLHGEVGRCGKVGGQFDIAVAQLASRGFEGAAAGVVIGDFGVHRRKNHLVNDQIRA